MIRSVSKIMAGMIAAPLRFYRYAVSPLIGPQCRFYPSCSAYALEALRRYGVFKGLLLSIRRLGKCHPWCRTHWHDPVPKRFTWGDIFGYKRRRKSHSSDHSCEY